MQRRGRRCLASSAQAACGRPVCRTLFRNPKEIFLQVFVRDNNVDQARRVLKKKMQREGVFREMRRRRFYQKPSEEAARRKSDAVRRMRKLERKQAIRDGSIAAPPPKKKEIKHRAAFPVQA